MPVGSHLDKEAVKLPKALLSLASKSRGLFGQAAKAAPEAAAAAAPPTAAATNPGLLGQGIGKVRHFLNNRLLGQEGRGWVNEAVKKGQPVSPEQLQRVARRHMRDGAMMGAGATGAAVGLPTAAVALNRGGNSLGEWWSANPELNEQVAQSYQRLSSQEAQRSLEEYQRQILQKVMQEMEAVTQQQANDTAGIPQRLDITNRMRKLFGQS